MHGIETDDGIGAAPSVARLLLELRGRVKIDVRQNGRALQVTPLGGRKIALRIHPGGADVAVEQAKAEEFALSIEGAYIKDPDDPNCFVVVPAELIDDNYDALFEASVQAVQLRATATTTAKATGTGTAATKTTAAKKTATKAAAKPAPKPEPPICSKCRQYQLLASGECPSGYC